MDFSDDEVCVRTYVEKEMRRARIISPVDMHRRTSGYYSDRESLENRRRAIADQDRRVRSSSTGLCVDDKVTVRRRHRQSRSHSSEDRNRSQSTAKCHTEERHVRSTVKPKTSSPSRDADHEDAHRAANRPHRSRRSSSRRSRHGYQRRHRSYSHESSSGDNSEVSTKLHHIKPKTFDGSGSFESFGAHFENCAKYNRWREKDKVAHLKASLVGEAAQVLWDSDEKLIDTLEKLLTLLKYRIQWR